MALIDSRPKTTGSTCFKNLTLDVRGVFCCTCSSSWGPMVLPPKGR